MIYACDNCHFLFERSGVVDACPDCGKPAIREAGEREQEEYWQNVRDSYSDNRLSLFRKD